MKNSFLCVYQRTVRMNGSGLDERSVGTATGNDSFSMTFNYFGGRVL